MARSRRALNRHLQAALSSARNAGDWCVCRALAELLGKKLFDSWVKFHLENIFPLHTEHQHLFDWASSMPSLVRKALYADARVVYRRAEGLFRDHLRVFPTGQFSFCLDGHNCRDYLDGEKAFIRRIRRYCLASNRWVKLFSTATIIDLGVKWSESQGGIDPLDLTSGDGD